MIIKTNRHLISSLRGANFRRVTLDGRTWSVRAVRTLRSLRAQVRHVVSTPRTIA